MTLGLIFTLYLGLNQNPNATPMILVNKQAKPFTAEWLQGKEYLDQPHDVIALADFLGKPLILNFWASWCYSCREEAKLVESYWKRYSSTDIKIVGIAVNDTTDAAMEFARYFGKTYILGLDSSGNAALNYGVTGVPETFFIDRRGIIKHKVAGPLSDKILDKYISLISQ